MKNLSKISKIFLYIAFLSGLLWIGSYFTRLLTTYFLFNQNDFELKNFISQENLAGILTIINIPVTITFVLYIIFIPAFIIFLISSGIKLKQNGWLFITTVLILLTFPFEVYLMVIDFEIIKIIGFAGNFEIKNALDLIVKRTQILSNFPLIEVFCYFSIIFFVIFQPLKVKTGSV